MVDQRNSDWDAHFLDIDDAAERAALLASVREDARFVDRQRATHEALGRWIGEVVAASAVPADRTTRAQARGRLLATLSTEERFRPFFADLGRYFALGADALRTVLRKIDRPASYEVAPFPGVTFFHFAPGAGAAFAEAGIVKLARGATFPRHEHLGEEVNFVLEGALIDAGVAHGPGSVVSNPAGSAHDYQAGPARDLILVAGHNGIRYLGG